MSQRSREILSGVIPIYLILCVWIFGNTNIMDETSFSVSQQIQRNDT